MLRETLKVGTPVKLADRYSVGNCFAIDADVTGVICKIDLVSHGERVVWVLLDRRIEALDEWHNRIELHSCSYDNDEEFYEVVNALLVATGPADVVAFTRNLAQEALDLAAAHIQNVLGVQTGDFAGVYFSDDLVLGELGLYAASEIKNLEPEDAN